MRKGKPVTDVNTTNELSSALVSNLSRLVNPKGNIRPKRKQNIGNETSKGKVFSSEAKHIWKSC